MAYWEHDEKKEDPLQTLLQAFAGDTATPEMGLTEMDETQRAKPIGQDTDPQMEMILQMLMGQG